MKKNKLADVLYELQNNPDFKDAFEKDAIKALQDAGLKISNADLKKILEKRDIQNEKLRERINK